MIIDPLTTPPRSITPITQVPQAPQITGQNNIHLEETIPELVLPPPASPTSIVDIPSIAAHNGLENLMPLGNQGLFGFMPPAIQPSAATAGWDDETLNNLPDLREGNAAEEAPSSGFSRP